MPRRMAVLVGAALWIATLAWAPLVAPISVRAAGTSAAYDTVLLASPAADAPVVVAIPAGAVLEMNGPPEGDFYPVLYNGSAGWIAAAALTFTKDGSQSAPGDAPPPAEASPPPTDPAAEAPLPTPEAAPPAYTPTGKEASFDAAPALASPAAAAEAAPVAAEPTVVSPVATAEATAPPDPANQEPAPPVVEPAAADNSPTSTPTPDAAPTPLATPTPTATAVPTPEPGPTGPATASTDLNLRASPDPNAGVVFLVPAGSTVEQTGQAMNGFVSATYMWMDGWLAVDYLEEPAPVAPEPAPTSVPAEDVRTPREGSGVAFAAIELSLRAGPSANEPVVGIVPVGGRVVLTGVTENGFHRVTYRDEVGWAYADYLSTPPDPDVGGSDGRGGGQEGRKTYTREQIVRIIYAAADQYGQSRQDMLRVAECESALDPYAVNQSGSYGLYQFIRSTWKSTPYGDQDIFDPAANANAAAWMWSVGRKSEWVCK